MTIKEVYELLCSRNYYELDSSTTFRFLGNTMFVDRRAGVPFSLQEDRGDIYLDTTLRPDRRDGMLSIVTNHPDGRPLHFFGKDSGLEVLVLD